MLTDILNAVHALLQDNTENLNHLTAMSQKLKKAESENQAKPKDSAIDLESLISNLKSDLESSEIQYIQSSVLKYLCSIILSQLDGSTKIVCDREMTEMILGQFANEEKRID